MKVNRIIKRARPWLIPIDLALSLFILLKLVFMLGYVPSTSMEPTLPRGSYILGTRIYTTLEEGDVIIFRHEGKLMVKRIAAVPGDSIDWSNQNYIENIPVPHRSSGTEIVPEDCYLVLGDNSNNSYDSRYWDEPFVYKESIIAKLVLF